MRKNLGRVTLYDTTPRSHGAGFNEHPVGRAGLVPSSKAPYQRWDGNQATYLFFPAFAAFVLVFLSSLSLPIIPGIYVVSLRMPQGSVTFGTWGWCTSNVAGFEDVCLGDPGTSGNKIAQLGELVGLNTMTASVPHSYLIAAGVMHVFANVFAWATVVWALASTGAWRNKEKHAWSWTRWAFRLTLASAVFILIAWSIDLGMFAKVSGTVSPDGSQPKIVPGPSVWMLMIAFILELACFVSEVGWLRNKPRPLWTTKAGDGDFHDPMPAPLSAALPPTEELPPTWESLAINTPTVSNEKRPLPDIPEETPSIEQRGFAV